MRYELTKSEAEQWILLCEEVEAKGFKVQGFFSVMGNITAKNFYMLYGTTVDLSSNPNH